MLLFLLGMLTADGPARRNGSRYRASGPFGRLAPYPADTDPQRPGLDAGARGQTRPLPPSRPRAAGGTPGLAVRTRGIRARMHRAVTRSRGVTSRICGAVSLM